MRISVIGAGYLGATHAICMASLGHEVVAVDVDASKVARLNNGELPFYEPSLSELLDGVRKKGLIAFTTDITQAQTSEFHFLCIGTPQQSDGLAADLSSLETAFASLSHIARSGSLIIGKSTVPVGTAQRFAEQLHETKPEVALVWNPEFLREGHAVADTLSPDRIVIGAANKAEAERLKKFYLEKSPSAPIFVTNFATAELVKVAANAFLATKISFINAMSEVADATGADVTVLADALGADERIGRKFLGAGIGFGGGCLPKDIRAFLAQSDELGLANSLNFLREFDQINQRARNRAVDLAVRALGDVARKKIAILGAAFKPESDDVRDSPALDIAFSLSQLGAEVVVHDPRAIDSARARFPNLTYSDSVEVALKDADLTMHLTEWELYRALDPRELHSKVKNPVIFDGRNALDSDKWRSAGWRFLALGRSL